jgi:trehalose 6-phosphate synthase
LEALPDATVAELLDGMAAHHACGFHTQRWADDFLASAHDLAGLAPTTFVSPLAPDPADLRATAASPECAAAVAELDAIVGDRALIGRVDRVELSKNQLRGFLAYRELLERHPEHHGRVVFVAGAYPSREGVPGYAEYRASIEAVVSSINERFGTPAWTPVVLDVDDDFPRSVALLRRADVLLVNPIRDGLNLVAFEGPLVSDREVVLALSPETGAWEQLHAAALAVPPFDVAGTADVLHAALTMPAAERSQRFALLHELAAARTPLDWLTAQLAAAD